MRRSLAGHGASRGSVLGRARLRVPQRLEVDVSRIRADAIDAELQRLADAIDQVRAEIRALRHRLHQGALAPELAEFLDVHALLVDDAELHKALETMVRDRHSAAHALRVQRDRMAEAFGGIDDPYLRARIEDIDLVIGRIHAALQQQQQPLQAGAGEILITDSIAPAELAQLQSRGVLAVVSSGGSPLSHTAILARSLHVPLITGVGDALQQINDGDLLVVDGERGSSIIEPDADDLRRHHARVQAQARQQQQLARLHDAPDRSRDGIDIHLWANAESAEDVSAAQALGASGIGLYRSEFLFLGQSALPDEDSQFRAYRQLLLGMAGRPVTIRLLDLGSDKATQAGLVLPTESNPALGVRGIRLLLAQPRLLQTQLRAIARASAWGQLRLLVPMLGSGEQLRLLREQLQQAIDAVRHAGHDSASRIEVGAMIEVPAAALALDGFIDDCDFISIGSNDLLQYLLAADRDNDALGALSTPLHPALPRLLRIIIDGAQRHRVPLQLCGEIAGDAALLPMLLALGLRQFSVHPDNLLHLRRLIRGCDIGKLASRRASLLRCADEHAVQRWLQRAQQAALDADALASIG